MNKPISKSFNQKFEVQKKFNTKQNFMDNKNALKGSKCHKCGGISHIRIDYRNLKKKLKKNKSYNTTFK
jgi:hypothetical protein